MQLPGARESNETVQKTEALCGVVTWPPIFSAADKDELNQETDHHVLVKAKTVDSSVVTETINEKTVRQVFLAVEVEMMMPALYGQRLLSWPTQSWFSDWVTAAHPRLPSGRSTQRLRQSRETSGHSRLDRMTTTVSGGSQNLCYASV